MATYCAKCEKKLRFIGGVGGRLEGKFICPNCQDELAEEAKHDRGLRWMEGSWRYIDDVPDRSGIHFKVSQWLRDMGLDLYETNFVDNDINSREILLMLAEHDLEKIGVGSLGHRKQMLASMDELRRERSEHPEERFDENKQTNAPAVQGPATEKQETYSGCVGFLTFFIPGLGQMIIGQGAKGAGMLIGAIALGSFSFAILSIPFMFWSYIDYRASVAHKNN